MDELENRYQRNSGHHQSAAQYSAEPRRMFIEAEPPKMIGDHRSDGRGRYEKADVDRGT